jgi:hypothetical protein
LTPIRPRPDAMPAGDKNTWSHHEASPSRLCVSHVSLTVADRVYLGVEHGKSKLP